MDKIILRLFGSFFIYIQSILFFLDLFKSRKKVKKLCVYFDQN